MAFEQREALNSALSSNEGEYAKDVGAVVAEELAEESVEKEQDMSEEASELLTEQEREKLMASLKADIPSGDQNHVQSSAEDREYITPLELLQGELYERLEEVAISRLVRFSQKIYNKYRNNTLAQNALRESAQRVVELLLQSDSFKDMIKKSQQKNEFSTQEMKDDLAESLYTKTMERIDAMKGRYKNKN